MIDDIIEFLQRAFKPDAMKRLFSVARFFAMLFAAAIACVYFASDSNIFAALGFAFTAFVLYRYGEIKGYIPKL